MSITSRINKQTMIYQYDRILQSNKMKQTTVKGKQRRRISTHYIEWKSLRPNSIWYVISFIECSRTSTQGEKEIRTVFVSQGGYWGLPREGHDEILGSKSNILYLHESVGYACIWFVKTQKMIHLSFMHSAYFIPKKKLYILTPS